MRSVHESRPANAQWIEEPIGSFVIYSYLRPIACKKCVAGQTYNVWLPSLFLFSVLLSAAIITNPIATSTFRPQTQAPSHYASFSSHLPLPVRATTTLSSVPPRSTAPLPLSQRIKTRLISISATFSSQSSVVALPSLREAMLGTWGNFIKSNAPSRFPWLSKPG